MQNALLVISTSTLLDKNKKRGKKNTRRVRPAGLKNWGSFSQAITAISILTVLMLPFAQRKTN
jgi:hypothetical protein